MTHVPTYNSFRSMRGRCEEPRTNGYKNYGGRGIQVCERWRGPGGYRRFLADMGERPAGKTIDRKDVDGHYTPENCRWATAQEQGANQRRTRRIAIDGVTKSLADWSDASSIRANTIASRIDRGWSSKDAVFSESRPTRSEIVNAAKTLGLSRFSIYDRIRKGWTLAEALSTPRMRRDSGSGPLLMKRRPPRHYVRNGRVCGGRSTS